MTESEKPELENASASPYMPRYRVKVSITAEGASFEVDQPDPIDPTLLEGTAKVVAFAMGGRPAVHSTRPAPKAEPAPGTPRGSNPYNDLKKMLEAAARHAAQGPPPVRRPVTVPENGEE